MGQEGGHIWGRAVILGFLFLVVHWKLWSAALWFTKKYQDTLLWPFSTLRLEPVMDIGTEELKPSISNSVIQVRNQLRVRLRGMVTLCTCPCCYRRSLTHEGPRAGMSWLCCTGLRLPGSFSCLSSFCSCHVCAWLQVDLKLKLKFAVACFSSLLLTCRYFFLFFWVSEHFKYLLSNNSNFGFQKVETDLSLQKRSVKNGDRSSSDQALVSS